jgi:hypothetical protein
MRYNVKAFKELIEKYKSITLEQITKMWDTVTENEPLHSTHGGTEPISKEGEQS